MADNKKYILLLFEKPGEPIFTPKGQNNTVFEVPENFLLDHYKSMGAEIQSRFGEDAGERIRIEDAGIPNLTIPMELSRKDNFSLFIPKHRKVATALTDIFLKARDFNQLQSYAAYARDRVNAQLFNYALSVALLHRPDTKDLDLPLFVESFPSKFMDSRVIADARIEAEVINQGSRRPIVIPRDYTASDLEPEHRLWYFREDMGINIHHWHWHLVYPFAADDISIVRKNRRGELFYYMHEQIVARYNFERFSNDLSRVAPINSFRDVVAEGYFSKLDTLNASHPWPYRASNVLLSDVKRKADGIDIKISTVERWRDRIVDAIQQETVTTTKGERIQLDDTTGIDILGNMMEATTLTPNVGYYGDFHNYGHVLLCFPHDPDHRHLESFGVVADPATAMRDPVFYRLHALCDGIFQLHKERLVPYTAEFLSFRGITITGLQIDSESVNILNTFYQQSDINLAKGMDFVPRGDIYARFTHLQHSPFTITIHVNNTSNVSKFGMARVFMAPKFNEIGQPFSFREQRLFMIELDKFVTQLRPGPNILKRRSTESTITIPFERTFRNLDERPQGGSGEAAFNFCGCGWPQHMLIPKGTAQGLASELFVMISDYEQDRVDQKLDGSCNDAASYCGIRDKLYPDKKAMGYPFDRLGRQGVDNLAQFMTPNMRTQDVRIVFEDVVKNKSGK